MARETKGKRSKTHGAFARLERAPLLGSYSLSDLIRLSLADSELA